MPQLSCANALQFFKDYIFTYSIEYNNFFPGNSAVRTLHLFDIFILEIRITILNKFLYIFLKWYQYE